jgi:hypothetical protein
MCWCVAVSAGGGFAGGPNAGAANPAAPQLAATPAGWTGFAQRNADLAATLSERSAEAAPSTPIK